VRFYTKVLGMHAGAIQPPNPIHGRSCGIYPNVNASVGLHFFEQAHAQALQPPPEMLQRLMFPSVGIHHIAFALPDAAGTQRLLERLLAWGIATPAIMDQDDVYNLLFLHNNGLLLEANWQVNQQKHQLGWLGAAVSQQYCCFCQFQPRR
jgi:hypothetical protein